MCTGTIYHYSGCSHRTTTYITRCSLAQQATKWYSTTALGLPPRSPLARHRTATSSSSSTTSISSSSHSTPTTPRRSSRATAATPPMTPLSAHPIHHPSVLRLRLRASASASASATWQTTDAMVSARYPSESAAAAAALAAQRQAFRSVSKGGKESGCPNPIGRRIDKVGFCSVDCAGMDRILG